MNKKMVRVFQILQPLTLVLAILISYIFFKKICLMVPLLSTIASGILFGPVFRRRRLSAPTRGLQRIMTGNTCEPLAQFLFSVLGKIRVAAFRLRCQMFFKQIVRWKYIQNIYSFSLFVPLCGWKEAQKNGKAYPPPLPKGPPCPRCTPRSDRRFFEKFCTEPRLGQGGGVHDQLSCP